MKSKLNNTVGWSMQRKIVILSDSQKNKSKLLCTQFVFNHKTHFKNFVHRKESEVLLYKCMAESAEIS